MPSETGPTPTTVAIVPHTHWDREWYSPFQAFRLRLVALLDHLLPLLERDLSYARFLLDGQTAVLDDYLEIRPEAAGALRRLATSGRLAVGPWMILMDEFMVSGETIVRDLQLGMARATELGGAMPVGYLPDMFGHVAQMPQLLRLAGLEHAVVWRGVPAAVTQTAFWWEAPDGSRVRAEYLYGSYSNGRDLPDDAKQLVARARGYELELGDVRLPEGGLLLMNGTDHQAPQPWLGRVVAEANAVQDDYHFVVSSLPEYLTDQPTAGLATWSGELRSGARANVLMGVASNRVDVHQACAAAERAIERGAEPLSALLFAPEKYPHALLDIAWRQLVLNSAHDSSCACSADEVVDAVVVRYQEARQIGDGLVRQALHALATEVDAPPASTIVVNPTGVDRGGMITVNLPGEDALHFTALDDGTPCATQVVRTLGGAGFARSVVGQKVRWILEGMHGPEFAGTRIGRYEVVRADDVVDVDCYGTIPNEPATDLGELREELLTLAEEDVTFNIRVHNPPVREVIVAVPAVAGIGWRTLGPALGAGPTTAVDGGDGWIANERVRVQADPRDGTWSITTEDGPRVSGLGRLVEGGDGGDTYNYSPPLEDVVVDRPESVEVALVESGPVRARLLIRSTYRWPERALGDMISCHARSTETVDVAVSTTLELRTGETFLRVRTELDNQCRDHRLRAHFPLPARVDHSDAECAFAVVTRGLTAEGGPHETPLPTFVSRRFVDASSGSAADGGVGLAVLHDGLLEYEVVDDGRELALTLLRATGYLSRADLLFRPNPAGPLDPLEGPQLQRDIVVEYALLPHQGSWEDANLHALADEVLVPLERVRGGGARGARRELTGRPLRVDGAVISAVLREPGGLVVRLYNPSSRASVAVIELDGAPATGWVMDLVGRPQEQFQAELELGAHRIATLRLD
jgi:mannosylglycerate hydrolase